MLVLTEEAYARATESSPNRNADEDVVPSAGVVELGGGGIAPGGRVMGLPVGILPSAKLILHRFSVREIRVGIWLRGTRWGNTITLRKAMTVVTSSSPSPGSSCLIRATIPTQRSPGLGELVVLVGRVPGREEDHVIVVAKRHELQTPKPDHRGQRERTFGVSHPEKWRENDVGT
jgi:hypothetical protein